MFSNYYTYIVLIPRWDDGPESPMSIKMFPESLRPASKYAIRSTDSAGPSHGLWVLGQMNRYVNPRGHGLGDFCYA